MNATLTLDEAGRILLPQELRDALQLGTGDVLALESTGEEIVLRPLHPHGSMVQEEGVWVFRAGTPLTARAAEETLEQVRRENEPGHTS